MVFSLGMRVDCVQCERLRAMAVKASRVFHDLTADLECAYLNHDLEAPKLISPRLDNASRERDATRAELFLHEQSHKRKKPADRPKLSMRQSA
jgi:hypothetical protein